MPIVDVYTLLGSWPHAEIDLTVEALQEGMTARGVIRSLVTHSNAIFYDPLTGNDLAVETAAQDPALMPVAVLNPLHFPGCLKEIERSLARGVGIFRLCPREHGYPMTESFGPLRQTLAALTGARLLLADLVGLPAPAITAGLPELLPVPTAFTVDADGLGTLIEAAARSRNVWLETSALDAGGAIAAAVRYVGSDRLLFGSRAPLRVLGSAVMSIQYTELSDEERAAIFEGNALRLLG